MPRQHASVDWPLICAFLRRRFGTLAAAARYADNSLLTGDNLNALANGVVTEPPFGRGAALLTLAADVLTDAQWAEVRAHSPYLRKEAA